MVPTRRVHLGTRTNRDIYGTGVTVHTDYEIESATITPSGTPGDLGRRVRNRRLHLGMTGSEVEEHAGFSHGYVEYLETQPTAAPSAGTIARLALALNSSCKDLLGGSAETVSGKSAATTDSRLVKIDEARCWELLDGGGVGRIVFDSEDGPIALPVNYRVANHTVLVRTSQDSVIGTIAPHDAVSFEVDQIDDAMSTGWSVLAYARCDHVGRSATGGEPTENPPTPWAGGERDHWLRLRIDRLVGRRIEREQ
jgi:transcriptional regulator with XRE-family HTH domain